MPRDFYWLTVLQRRQNSADILHQRNVPVHNVAESLSREIGEVRERVDRMSVRLDKIAAGAHYVTRLVEWSEKQDKFQEDILRRVQVIESRLDIRPEAQ